jgi:uncharacterized protein (DUF1330 family)
MPAYLLNYVRGITSREEMMPYWAEARKTYDGKGKMLVAYTPFEVLEGHDVPIWGVVAMEWPTMQAAREWYYGPRYTAARKLRAGVQDNICVLVDGGWINAEDRGPPADFIGTTGWCKGVKGPDTQK